MVKKTVEERYNKLEQREHILLRPDTFIGSVEEDTFELWVYDPETKKNVTRVCTIVPGLYKIYDEVIVNAKDHSMRDKTCKNIRITINVKTGEITCFNDGNEGVAVEIHKKYKIWVPELIFGNLLTGENYDDTEQKYVGGKNGYGAKLTNIYSTKFTVEVYDSNVKKLYIQHFYDNMSRKDEPIITKMTGKSSYCKISFIPDFKKFGITSYNEDTIALFKKRVYDIAACTANTNVNKSVRVYLDDELINIKNFKDYIDMFYDDEEDEPTRKMVYEEPNENWKVCAIFDPDGFKQVSYVNGIYTIHGGTHVQHVTDQIVDYLEKVIGDKDKNIKVKRPQIKECITVFVDSLIDKPNFSSQIKEQLTTKISNFDSKCVLSEDFMKKFAKTGIVEEVLAFAKLKEQSAMKKINGVKVKNINIPKLDDAHLAGTKHSSKCRLILTEGDSAKTFAINGLQVIGKEKYGVFPLKGKPLNVREQPPKKIMANDEIRHVLQILGLRMDKTYEDKKDFLQLRYGGILIIADQDLDGSHIKGLIINFIERFWPALVVHMEYSFIQTLPTPIVKTWLTKDIKKAKVNSFYTLSEYNNWTKKNTNYKSKYYKGLGTFSHAEAAECFSNYEDKVITYIWDNKATKEIVEGEDSDNAKIEYKKSLSSQAINLAFSKINRNARKKWLQNYFKDDILENDKREITYYDFIHKDLKHFSFYDNARSIPSICDMLKPSTRKILFSAFLKKDMLKNEIKVAQFAGFVSQMSAYHHGEKSLEGAIVGLAQNYTGSNNINLLKPNGNFGSRLQMGKDAASSRYIFTQISEITPYIFRQEDECILNYLDDDGKKIEPEHYLPITPIVLTNGGEGIGTGFSTKILCYNPINVNSNMRNMIKGLKLKEMTPWFRGFKGTVTKVDNFTFETRGVVNYIDENTITITELPIGMGTDKYMEFLKSFLVQDSKNIKSTEMFTDIYDNNGIEKIDIKLIFVDNVLGSISKTSDMLMKKLKLTSKISSSNMHLHSTSGTLKKYNTVNEIFEEFYPYRLSMYEKRKKVYLAKLKNDLDIIKWKVKFLELNIAGKIIIANRTKKNVLEQVEKLGFPKFVTKGKKAKEWDDDSEEIEGASYSYLEMGIFNLTTDMLKKLKDLFELRTAEYIVYRDTPVENIWLKELDELEKMYPSWLENSVEKDEEKLKIMIKAKGKKTK